MFSLSFSSEEMSDRSICGEMRRKPNDHEIPFRDMRGMERKEGWGGKGKERVSKYSLHDNNLTGDDFLSIAI